MVALQGGPSARAAAKKESALLDKQQRVVSGGDEWRARLDPAVARAAYEAASKGPASRSLEVAPAEPREDEPPSMAAEKPEAVASPKRYRPAYVRDCEEMDFGALRRYIYDSLEALSEPGSVDGPRSVGEFRSLLDVLRSKIDDFPEIPPAGPRPRPARRKRFGLRKTFAQPTSNASACGMLCGKPNPVQTTGAAW
jgi:hypothetical protein